MKHPVRRSAVAAGLATLLALGFSTAAHAAPATDSAAPATDSAASPVAFAAFGDASFADVYDSMIELNDPAAVAEVLDALAESESPNLEELKLDEYTPEEAATIVEGAAESAREGTSLPSALRGPAQAPILGAPSNDHYSWTYSDRVEYFEWVGPFPVVKAWLDFRITTDPNDVNTASQWNATRGGDGRLTKLEMHSTLYQDDFHGGSQETSWNVPGFGTQWNIHPQRPNDGYRFQMEYGLTAPLPNGGEAYMSYSTGQSRVCGEQIPSGFACFFPDQ